jgi:acyl carrier protein
MKALEAIRSIVAAHFGVSSAGVRAETTLADLRAADLDRIEIVMNVEDNFRVLFSDADMHRFATVGELAAMVDVKRQGREQASAALGMAHE